ncbi:MAG: hotdog fold thioesterase [Pseudonocardiaceae bacterium]|nr:hotdog fold thioesterase [Pseudonocardiaceae bacterium]
MTTTEAATAHDWGEPRSKTVTWYDPFRAVRTGSTMSGRDYLEAMIEGKLPPPPISGLLDMRGISVSDGQVVFGCTPDESTYNPIGLVHGGLVCTLLDSAAGCAVHSTLPAGTGYTSAEIKVNYLRPIHAHTGELTARGWVTKPGRRIAFAEADLRDPDGNLLATASSTCLIMSM